MYNLTLLAKNNQLVNNCSAFGIKIHNKSIPEITYLALVGC